MANQLNEATVLTHIQKLVSEEHQYRSSSINAGTFCASAARCERRAATQTRRTCDRLRSWKSTSDDPLMKEMSDE